MMSTVSSVRPARPEGWGYYPPLADTRPAQLRLAPGECRPSGLPWLAVMTLEEARSNIGQNVMYSAAGAEAEEAVIAYVTGSWVLVRCRCDNRFTSARPGGI